MLHKCSILRIAEIFFNEPTKQHYLIEISKKSKIAHTSVKKHLACLKKLSVIKESFDKKGKRTFPVYMADLESDGYKKYKKISNLLKLEESKLADFLKDECMPKSIVVFGSYLRGEDIEDSDIDIFVECKTKSLELNKFEKQLNRKIQLHFKENFKDYPNELKNNIANGFVLRGYLEAFK